MSAKLNYAIGAQRFELVRNRLGEILIEEFDNQLLLTGDYDLDVDVTVEGSNPYIDKVELPNINVSVLKGTYGNKNQGSSDGTYTFAIDAYAMAYTTSSAKGDVIATKKVQRLIGIIRTILEDPQYKTLGYTPGFVMRTLCSQFDVMEIKRDDANNTIGARLLFTAHLNESATLKTVSLIDGYDTTVKLGSTDVGYFYQGENY
jgi:hypothetical protein